MEIKDGSKDFKILYLSNAPFTPSGYGNQCAGNCYGWNKHYNVRILSNYGLQGNMLALPEPYYGVADKGLTKGSHEPVSVVPIYPNLHGDDNADRTAELIFRHWNPDIFVTMYDIWMGAYVREGTPPKMFRPIHPHWIPIIMVDHEPIPEATLIQAADAAFRIVTPTHFGVEQFKQYNVPVEYIPFGIHTNIFKPLPNKKELKLSMNRNGVPFSMQNNLPITEDSFVVFINGANKDPYRKAFMRMFIAFQIFLENNPDAKKDARIYVHSWMKLSRDIPHGAKTLHIEEYCKGTADYHNLCGIPAPRMAELYNAGDVFMHLAQGGGFEIPLLETMSCGVPPIASDFVCMTELVKDHGWLIPTKAKYFSPLDALQCITDEFKAAEALEDAYNHPEKRKRLGDAGRKFAEGFDWSLVNPQWYRLFEELRDTWRPKPLNSRRI